MKVTIDYGEELWKAKAIFENGKAWDFKWIDELNDFVYRQGEDIYTLKSTLIKDIKIRFWINKNAKISDLVIDEVIILPNLYKRMKDKLEEYFVKINLLPFESLNRVTTSQNVVISGSQGVSIVQSGDGKRTVIID